MTEHSFGDEVRYMPLIEFDGASSDFVNGAQIGQLIEKLTSNRSEAIQALVNRENEEYVERIANAFGREYSIQHLDEAYMVVSFEPPSLPNIVDALVDPPSP